MSEIKTNQSLSNGSDSWLDRTVLVTGAGGFIASHLVETLVLRGSKVRAFVRYNSRGDPGLLSMLSPELLEKVEVIAGDLRDTSAVRQATEGISHVFHLGALIAIPYSYLHPAEVVETNVIGTLNILMAAREYGIQRVVHTSTSEVYGSAIYTPIDEKHPLQGQSPYSASKIGADKLVESFYRSYDLPVVTLRPFNTYGPRQSARAVIPTIIHQALRQNLIYLGNIEARRDITYVTDTVSGFLKVAEVPGIEGETFNLGTGYEVSITDLVKEIGGLLGTSLDVAVEPQRLRPVKSEVQRLLSDNRLARQRLKWEPLIPLRDGLRATIDWIKTHLEHYPREYQV